MAYFTLKSYKLKTSPLEIFALLKNERNCFFLDSSLNRAPASGRYSFLGIEPFYVLEVRSQEPFTKLRQALSQYRISSRHCPLPFLGGAVGYLSYDLGFLLEKKLQKRISDDLKIPSCVFGFYNTAIIIDNLKKILYIFAAGFPEKRYGLAKTLCEANFKKIYNLLSWRIAPPKLNAKNKPKPSPFSLKSNFSKEDYLAAVKKAKRYIRAGDIYQVNLSQRFETKTKFLGFEIYQRLRQISPSHFGAYFDCGDFQIMSSSPERFLSLRGNLVTTRPMKGTRGRSPDKLGDQKLKAELLKSVKDKAELTMIVDLERNDLGKVCSYSSVKVNRLRQLEEYATVFQTTATICGVLHQDKDRIDLLRACFPGGSITGCPKIRAMEIIEELEPHRRSIYTGSLGYLSFSGDMDFNILIRTILKKQERLYFGVGGGIVADSQAPQEYEETLIKAGAMMQAVS